MSIQNHFYEGLSKRVHMCVYEKKFFNTLVLFIRNEEKCCKLTVERYNCFIPLCKTKNYLVRLEVNIFKPLQQK